MSFTEMGRLVEEQVWGRHQEFSLPCLLWDDTRQTSPVADKTDLYFDTEFSGRVRPGAFDSRVAKSYLALCKPMDCSPHRVLWPSPSPRVCPSSCPLSQWCHPSISSSASLFSFAFSLFQHQVFSMVMIACLNYFVPIIILSTSHISLLLLLIP